MLTPSSPDALLALLERGHYVADRSLATALHLALSLHRPLLLEGRVGVGKTALARTLATGLGRRLLALHCHEGLDLAHAVYEWNVPAQLLELRLLQADKSKGQAAEAPDLFDPRYLIRRPLLEALSPDPAGPPVLLIDEVDRADPAFEAYLLEFLTDFAISVPETGTIAAAQPPIVIITSNRTRPVSDALKRRCLYHFIPDPDAATERRIVEAQAPGATERLSHMVVEAVKRVQRTENAALGDVAEAMAWTNTLFHIDKTELDPERVSAILNLIMKYQDEMLHAEGSEIGKVVKRIRAEVDALENA
ncbi:MAG: MoxR family ATPase [Alphaproteobacteria bacterium]|nr:MoxR family ATPase [Alphaproteobacteria bacterium]